jgi:hypothetical protein
MYLASASVNGPNYFSEDLLCFVLTDPISAGPTIIKLISTAVITLTVAEHSVGNSSQYKDSRHLPITTIFTVKFLSFF